MLRQGTPTLGTLGNPLPPHLLQVRHEKQQCTLEGAVWGTQHPPSHLVSTFTASSSPRPLGLSLPLCSRGQAGSQAGWR